MENLFISNLLITAIYFLPTWIGIRRRDYASIFIVNLFLGWTLIGWVIALAWACYPNRRGAV